LSNSSPYALSHYYQTQVTTADKREVVLYLYEGAIKYLRQALVALEAGDIPEKCQRLSQAMDIIMELACMLDFERGGEIAVRLNSLYTFTLQSLLEANTKKTFEEGKKPIRQCLSIITTIRDGWAQILKYTPSSAAPQQLEDATAGRKRFVG
jgi:flagellar protein FliS